MKRINKIEIENSRAYYDRLIFSLEKGENLLLYGENGSGKTSLYKALNDFIQSFYSPVQYICNRYMPFGASGEILLSIGDFDANNREFSNLVDYRFADDVNNTNVQNTGYLKALALSKGFLSYRDLLKIYLSEDENPNLFYFFIEHLLGFHVPVAQGKSYSLYKRWELVKDEIFNVYSRQEQKHKRGLDDLNDFEIVLRSVLANLFAKVNNYLATYFDNLGLEIDFELKPLIFSYGVRKNKWKIQEDLRLTIKLEKSSINDYTKGLNEARLSAIAICLYLAALQANPGKDLHFMFLDDIFIGIDSSNRRPILEILNKEFNDFQIVITTYDRSWYYMAKNYLEKHTPNNWKYINLYSISKTERGQTFTVPVATTGDSAFDRAKEYLHGLRDVDLPAAANYFRKALEELFLNLPKELFINDDYTIVPGFKLTQRAKAVEILFSKIGENMTHILFIESYLHPLIHPLSHYEEEAQIYRNELLEIEKAISELMIQIEHLPRKCQLLVGRGNRLVIKYRTADNMYNSEYYVILDDNIWIYKDEVGNVQLIGGKCKMVYMKGVKNGVELEPFAPNKKMRNFNNFCYESLDDALRKIFTYETNVKSNLVVAHNNYDIVYQSKGNTVGIPINIRREQLLANMA